MFRQHDNPLFNYPFQPRKSILGKQEINFEQQGHEAFTVKFDLSDVCLEGHYMDELAGIPENLWETITRTLGIKEEKSDLEKVKQECESGK